MPERTPDEIAADDAAGRTWINYGIIAGFNRRLYGAALSDTGLSPAQGWIYVDDDGDRWMVRISFADFSVLRLRFRRICAPSPMSITRKNVAVSGQSRNPDIFILCSTAFSY